MRPPAYIPRFGYPNDHPTLLGTTPQPPSVDSRILVSAEADFEELIVMCGNEGNQGLQLLVEEVLPLIPPAHCAQTV